MDDAPLASNGEGRFRFTAVKSTPQLSMLSLSTNVASDGQPAFEALVDALASATQIKALTARNCREVHMASLSNSLLSNDSALRSIQALDVSAPAVGWGEKPCLRVGGAHELSKCLARLGRLKVLNMRGEGSSTHHPHGSTCCPSKQRYFGLIIVAVHFFRCFYFFEFSTLVIGCNLRGGGVSNWGGANVMSQGMTSATKEQPLWRGG